MKWAREPSFAVLASYLHPWAISIGSLLTHHLRQAHIQPILLSREHSPPVASISLESDGVSSTHRNFRQEPLESSNPIEILLVCCKQQASVGLLKQLSPRLTRSSILVLLQYGLSSLS